MDSKKHNKEIQRMICRNPNCNFKWHCFVRKKENKDFMPPCASLKERRKKMNPRITELKPYKGFNIIKEETFSNWSCHVTYFAYKEVKGGVKEYIDDCNDLAKLKKKIRLRCYEEVE